MNELTNENENNFQTLIPPPRLSHMPQEINQSSLIKLQQPMNLTESSICSSTTSITTNYLPRPQVYNNFTTNENNMYNNNSYQQQQPSSVPTTLQSHLYENNYSRNLFNGAFPSFPFYKNSDETNTYLGGSQDTSYNTYKSYRSHFDAYSLSNGGTNPASGTVLNNSMFNQDSFYRDGYTSATTSDGLYNPSKYSGKCAVF